MSHTLLDTLQHLKPSDISLIRKHLEVANESKQPSIRQKLLEYLIENPTANVEATNRYVYGKSTSPAATLKLMERFENEILAILSVEGVIHANFSESVKARMLIHSWLASFQFLKIRGASKSAAKIMARARKFCARYEFVTQDLFFLTYLQEFQHHKNTEVYDEYGREIELQIQRLQQLQQSRSLIGRFTSRTGSQKTISEDIKKEIVEILSQLDELSQQSNLVRVRFEYLKTLVFKQLMFLELNEAYDNALKLLDIVQNSPPVRSKNNLAGCHMVLCEVSIQMNQSERAIFFGSSAVELFRSGTINHLRALDYLFIAQLRSNDLISAEETLKIAQKSPSLASNPITPSRWLFYQAALHFMRGEFTSALRILNRNLEITKDKTGWLASVKILEIMCYLDLRDYDMADYRIEALRHMLINPQKTDQLARLQKITKLLNGLRKSLYDWREFHKKNKVAIEEFLTKEVWHTTDVDIVNFNTWLERKCERLPPITNS